MKRASRRPTAPARRAPSRLPPSREPSVDVLTVRAAQALEASVNALGERWLERAKHDAETIRDLRADLAGAEQYARDLESKVNDLESSLTKAQSAVKVLAARLDAVAVETTKPSKVSTALPDRLAEGESVHQSPREQVKGHKGDFRGCTLGTYVVAEETAERYYGQIVWVLRCPKCNTELRWYAQKLREALAKGRAPGCACTGPSWTPRKPRAASTAAPPAPPAPPAESSLRAAREPVPRGCHGRSKTLTVEALSLDDLELGRRSLPEETSDLRPKTRGECADGLRPCPFVSCRHHLYLDVSPKTGAIKLNFPDVDLDEIPETCSLDVADAGVAQYRQVGALLNMSHERARQIEVEAVERLHRLPVMRELRDAFAGESVGAEQLSPLALAMEEAG